VSSSDDDGTQALYREAPDLIIPELRPYRVRSDLGTWTRDRFIIPYVEDRLKRYRYVAIGEFHVYGADAELPVVRHMVQLAREHKLLLHVQHAGFAPPATVREMLRRYRNLWCDLSWRTDHAPGGKLNPEWRPLFLELPERFMVGTDTPSPEHWERIVEHARLARSWLSELPADVAEKIAWRNGEALFGPLAAALKRP
jgi:hypothetical protein